MGFPISVKITRQQLTDAIDGVIGDSGQHFSQVCFWIPDYSSEHKSEHLMVIKLVPRPNYGYHSDNSLEEIFQAVLDRLVSGWDRTASISDDQFHRLLSAVIFNALRKQISCAESSMFTGSSENS